MNAKTLLAIVMIAIGFLAFPEGVPADAADDCWTLLVYGGARLCENKTETDSLERFDYQNCTAVCKGEIHVPLNLPSDKFPGGCNESTFQGCPEEPSPGNCPNCTEEAKEKVRDWVYKIEDEYLELQKAKQSKNAETQE